MKTKELAKSVGQDDPLGVAIDDLARKAFIRFGMLAGGAQVFDEISLSAEVKRVEMLQKIRDEELWKAVGYKTWDDCAREIEGGRRQANRKIQELKDYGPDFISVRAIARLSPSVFQEMDVKDGVITTETGEKIAINRENQGRIKELVTLHRNRLRELEEQKQEKEREAKKFKEERDEQKRAAENARDEVRQLKRAEQEAFADADPDHRQMLLIQSRIEGALLQAYSVNDRELAHDNSERLVALCDHLWRVLARLSFDVKRKWGFGDEMPEAQFNEEEVAFASPAAQNLVELHTKGKGRK